MGQADIWMTGTVAMNNNWGGTMGMELVTASPLLFFLRWG